jgi:hypothetical protein
MNNDQELENRGKYLKERKRFEDDELIIEDNTIYEIDLDCYSCLQRKRKEAGL